MINDFLFRLVNDTHQVFGRIPKPSAAAAPYTGARRMVQDALLFGGNARDRFKAAVSLTMLLRHSMLAELEISGDTRVTYTDADLSAELMGDDDVISSIPGVGVTYTAGAHTPSEATWALVIFPGNKVSAVSSMGTEVVDAVFSATESVTLSLRNGGIAVHIIGVPQVGESIVISRRAAYRYDIGAAAARLDTVGEPALLDTTPLALHSLLRNAFAQRVTTKLVVAAIGVAHGP